MTTNKQGFESLPDLTHAQILERLDEIGLYDQLASIQAHLCYSFGLSPAEATRIFIDPDSAYVTVPHRHPWSCSRSVVVKDNNQKKVLQNVVEFLQHTRLTPEQQRMRLNEMLRRFKVPGQFLVRAHEKHNKFSS